MVFLLRSGSAGSFAARLMACWPIAVDLSQARRRNLDWATWTKQFPALINAMAVYNAKLV
jgi:hypothetical protein